MKKRHRMISAAAVVAAALVLAGCRAEEQGRPLSFDKGSYAGEEQKSLSEAKVNALDERVTLQSGGVAVGAPTERPTEQAIPAGSNDSALSNRLQQQSGK